ncbi:carboxypeptidase-like regulatory domain-containing protein (plasmid) [Priestia megaterium]|uniref:carboxypeptidase-like regulatory domain-containing protein n=1 Tax=Priestia megaterium TaxID=1404 RepID=UPI0035BE1A54
MQLTLAPVFKRLLLPASLSGTVTDAQTGSPIAGTLVQVFVIGMTVPIKSTLTDDNGQYRITDLPSATYTIIVFARNFTTQSLNVTLMNGKERKVDIQHNLLQISVANIS